MLDELLEQGGGSLCPAGYLLRWENQLPATHRPSTVVPYTYIIVIKLKRIMMKFRWIIFYFIYVGNIANGFLFSLLLEAFRIKTFNTWTTRRETRAALSHCNECESTRIRNVHPDPGHNGRFFEIVLEVQDHLNCYKKKGTGNYINL
jgi:hypothetical protein